VGDGGFALPTSDNPECDRRAGQNETSNAHKVTAIAILQGFHHQGETTAFPGPRHGHLMDSVGATTVRGTQATSSQRYWKKSHMPPACFDGVVDSTRCFADRALEMFPCNVLEWQFQTLRFSLKAALGHSPLSTQSQCCKKFPPGHSSY
jgi:hypothetical protein